MSEEKIQIIPMKENESAIHSVVFDSLESYGQ